MAYRSLSVWITSALCLLAVSATAVENQPVVVELFESQGCSSCPPAEHVMSALRQSFGPSVILLTCHVDYWDYLGWKDTFSDPNCTERQKTYGRAFNQDSIYTPEMVVQGETGFNGADLGQAKREVSSRLDGKRPRFTIKLLKKTSSDVTLSVELPPEVAQDARRLTAVVYEDALPVQVLRGENKGETMTGNFAVRKIIAMPTPVAGHSKLSIHLEAGWDITKTGVAVLVQGDTPAIVAAEAVPWPKIP